MDAAEFRTWGKKMVDYVADYWENIRDRTPLPDVQPGYIKNLMPDCAPEQPEGWEDIFKDLDNVVMPGVTHWHHPNFFAYFPTALSYPAVMADILSSGLCMGFTWISSPACTELEMVVVDWVAKILKLPDYFLNTHPGPGAGMIQCTASDCALVALLTARHRILKKNNFFTDSEKKVQIGQLVAYCSEQAHSSIERSALLSAVKIRKLATDDESSLRGSVLEKAIKTDMQNGMVPFFVCATLGTTPTCSFDNLPEIGRICQKFGLYLHVDAAYAGSAFICPEYRHHLDGVELVDSYNFNAHKLLLVNFDCSLVWFKDATEVENSFMVDPVYLKHKHQKITRDFRNLQIPLGRRFRALKLWFVLRCYGIVGLQEHIRKHCALAQEFSLLVEASQEFELFGQPRLGLVCFRLKGTDEKNELLCKKINEDRRIHIVPTNAKGEFVLRFAVCSTLTTSNDVASAWKVIQQISSSL